MDEPGLDLWNVHDNIPYFAGSQSIANIVGRVKGSELPERLEYCLNDGPIRPAYIKRSVDQAPRLISIGDFHIDTITGDMLRPNNTIDLAAHFSNGIVVEKSVTFPVKSQLPHRHSLRQRLEDAQFPEQVGQVVDGGWIMSVDEHGKKCIELPAERAGYDRIILLSEPIASPNYMIRTRLCVSRWLRPLHHVGFVFDWNPHLQGDATTLPDQWSTGLAHYHSASKGLRFRVGVNVHFNEGGKKVGGHNFAEGVLNPWRAKCNKVLGKLRLSRKALPQLVCGRNYDFELKVESRRHSLTVWPADSAQPEAQVVEPALPDLLSGGVAGIILHYGVARVYEFEIKEGP